MTVNPERGEVEIVLEGTTFGLRPTYEAIVAIEKATDRTLVDLARDANVTHLPLAVCAIIVTELIRAWGKAKGDVMAQGVQVERIGHLLMDEGMPTVQVRLALVLVLAATGGYTPSGEMKAVATTTPEVPTAASPRTPRARSAGPPKGSG